MQTLNGKMASFVAVSAVVGGVPLLAFMLLFLEMMAARNAGHPQGGDAIGIAIMSLLAYGLALLSLFVSAGYFGYKRLQLKLCPNRWHLLAVVLLTVEVATPVFYFTFV